MRRRSIIWAVTIVLLLLYLTLQGLANLVFLRRSPPNEDTAQEKLSLHGSQGFRIKVYMYDLPKEFTYGVIEQYLKARGILKSPVLDDKDLKYPGNQHGAEWSLFTDMQRPEGEKWSSAYVRVFDKDQADVFYVPFFSSLSLTVIGPGSNEDVKYSDDKMQEKLMAWLEEQETWQRYGGRDHVIICQDPNALYLIRERIKKCVLLLSDFGRFAPDQASFVKDVVLPYSHRINSYIQENSTLKRDTLLFFMGNRYRKEGGKIRDQLFQILENEKDMIIKHGTQSRESRRLAAQGMRSSKFCLHPAGDTPSACRLFDAIVSICVPVIVSDDIELPFEDELDYSKFAVFVPTYKAVEPDYLPSLLRQMDDEIIKEKQQRLREVRKYFEYEEPNGAIDQIWRQVRKKLPLIKTLINRDKRLVEGSTANCSCVCSSRQGSANNSVL